MPVKKGKVYVVKKKDGKKYKVKMKDTYQGPVNSRRLV